MAKPDEKNPVVAVLEVICAEQGIDFYSLSADAHQVLTALVHDAQEYAQFVMTGVKDQLIAQIDRVPKGDRRGYQLAIRALAEGEWEKL